MNGCDISIPNASRLFRLVNPVAGEDWPRVLSAHPRATIFHSSAWARVLCDTYGYKPFYFVTGDAGSQTACPLIEVDSWLTGRRGIVLPFTDECEVLSENENGFEQALACARELGREREWRSVEFRGVPAAFEQNASVAFYGHHLDLRDGSDELFRRFDGSVRRAIRKAERLGVQAEIERSIEAVGSYYQLHCLTRKKHGLPPQPIAFFEMIYRQVIEPGFGFVSLARVGGKVVAGAVFFTHNGQGLYKFGGSNPRCDSLRPSNLAMWKGVQELCRIGIEGLSFGRTSLFNEGLRRYKLGWGSRETTIRYLKWDFDKGGFTASTDHSGGLHSSVFRNCPLLISRLIGRLIYPHIA